jgi:cytokinin dehydrogenase
MGRGNRQELGMDKTRLSRRTLLGGAAAAAVVAFDPVGLRWLTAAEASAGIDVPDLDGELVIDPEALAEAGSDYGNIVHNSPQAVLRPGSVQDIVRIVRYANKHRIGLAMRGQGHATFGQAQVATGIVIDSRTLATIHEISPDGAVVDAGVTWLALTQAALSQGLTPPVSTDYLGLSVGGTLSVGGIGGASSHHGLQVDNVLELDVVTGGGRLLTCSERRNRKLFQAVLGGLGQFAIIVRATVRLIPAETTARVYHLVYSELSAMTAAQRTALADGRFDYLEGQVLPVDGGGWSYLLEGAVYFSAPDEPDDAELLGGLNPVASEIFEQPYFEWLNRLFDLIEQLKPLGLPNPWVNLFLPAARTDAFVGEVLAELTPADTGGGPILLYPIRRRLLTRPFVPVPHSNVVFLLSILRTVFPPDPAEVERLIAANRAMYEKARALGGTQYAIGSIPMSTHDWIRHFGPTYPRFALAKAMFDPKRVLAPGQGIFPS